MDIKGETIIEHNPKKLRLEHVLDGTYINRIEIELEMCVEAIEVVPDCSEGIFYYEDDIPEGLRDAARQVERDRMKQFHVKEDLPEKDCDQKFTGRSSLPGGRRFGGLLIWLDLGSWRVSTRCMPSRSCLQVRQTRWRSDLSS